MTTLENSQNIEKTHPVYHGYGCPCTICRKQQEIQQIRKLQGKMNLRSIYKNDYATKNPKDKAEKQDINATNQNITRASDYVDLQSTYLKEFERKNVGDIIKNKPIDNLKSKGDSLPVTSTYMRAYHSTLTPKPDDPFVRAEMPIGGNKIPFQGESIYQKEFNREKTQKQLRPSLPIIRNASVGRPNVRFYQSTHKRSYSTLDPQLREKYEKPKQSLVSSKPYAYNYETTYKNYYLAMPTVENHYDKYNQLYNIYKKSKPFQF